MTQWYSSKICLDFLERENIGGIHNCKAVIVNDRPLRSRNKLRIKMCNARDTIGRFRRGEQLSTRRSTRKFL